MSFGMLNREKASELFDHEAILIKDQDVIPLKRVVELFGKQAVEFVKRNDTNHHMSNIYGIGDGKQLEYFYRSGFFAAVTYVNIDAALSHYQEKQHT